MRTGLDARTEGRLVRLMAARLVLTLVSIGIAFGLETVGRDLAPDAREGLYWTVAAAFLATIVSGLWLRRVGSAPRFAAVQLVTDILLVSSLVYFSGGRESIFTFLYVCVTVYGAVLFDRRGALGAAVVSALAYAAVLLAGHESWPFGGAPVDRGPLSVLGVTWGVHVGALFLVGVLASVLSNELARTGKALDQRTHALHRLRDLHERTIDSIMSGVLTTDPSLRITSFNPEAERITGARASEVFGRSVGAVIPGAEDVLEATPGGVADRRARRSRLDYRSRGGELLHLGLAGSILRDEEGGPSGFVLIFQDVTQVVKMEAELRRSERLAAVGELSAKIAHEIRNPLAAISGSIETLRAHRKDGGGEDPADRLMGIAVRETERLNALITDFLCYARPTAPHRKAVNVAAVVEEVMNTFEASRPEALRVDLTELRRVEAFADPDQLRQVVWNLCLNAAQAMPDGGTLAIGAQRVAPQEAPWMGRNDDGGPSPDAHGALDEEPSGRVELWMRDTGGGIPPEVQEHMFEPFFTTKREGSGLGLSTVHRIVESHGGTLAVETEAGVGTTFRIRFAAGEGA